MAAWQTTNQLQMMIYPLSAHFIAPWSNFICPFILDIIDTEYKRQRRVTIQGFIHVEVYECGINADS